MQHEAAPLIKNLQTLPQKTLHNALQEEALGYYREITEGLNVYVNASVKLHHIPYTSLWAEGSSRLLEYSSIKDNTGNIVVFVPSLINRSYIFDLKRGNSFLEYIKEQNTPCVLLDWGEPTEAETTFGIEQYIGRLARAIEYLHQISRRRIVLAGYCMGGVMSLAYCQQNPEYIAGLALLATPWNFHAEDVTRFNLTGSQIQQWETQLLSQPILPKEAMQMVFYALYAQHIHKKYQMLARLDPLGPDMQELLAIEYWANDGMGIPSGVARDCLIAWGYHNTPMQGKWQVGGRAVIPEAVSCPTLVAIAKHDRIASYHSALPLAKKIKGSTLLVADTGHVGMIAGRYAKTRLWEKFSGWVKGLL